MKFALDQIETVEENAVFILNNKSLVKLTVFKRHSAKPYYYACFRGAEYKLTTGETYKSKMTNMTLEYASGNEKVLKMYKMIEA